MKLRTKIELSVAAIGACLVWLATALASPDLTFGQGTIAAALGALCATGSLTLIELFVPSIMGEADHHDLTTSCHGRLERIRDGLQQWSAQRQAAHNSIPWLIGLIQHDLAAAEQAMVRFPYSLGRALSHADLGLWRLSTCDALSREHA